MGRSHWHPSTCRICGRTADEVGAISQSGLCPEDSVRVFEESLDQLRAKSGPHFRYWRRRLAESMERLAAQR